MNPFIISAYKSPAYFCDREKETKVLIDNVSNGINILLYSLRRMGKTGLIKNTFHQLNTNTNFQLLYIDIYRTKNVDDFVNELANAMLRIHKKTWYQKAFDFIKSLRPIITVNPISGQMEAEIKPIQPGYGKTNLESIFTFFENYPDKIIIAIDEFQQITEYPEPGFEAFLRSKIQFLNNVNFIFSGSNRRMITAMFNDYNRPFYQSGSSLYLDKIPHQSYIQFITKLMEETGRSISEELIQDGLLWTNTHTWFTQNYFNRLWGKGSKQINSEVVNEVRNDIYAEKERDFIELRHLLPENQMNLLIAIAKEDEVKQPTAKDFLTKYRLGSASTINSALKALENKEMIYFENDQYQLYDPFLKRFLQN